MIAVGNSALINLLMASRLVYGMSEEGVLPVGRERQHQNARHRRHDPLGAFGRCRGIDDGQLGTEELGRPVEGVGPRPVAVGRAPAATGVAEGPPAPDRRVAVLTPEPAGFSLYLGLYGESGEGL